MSEEQAGAGAEGAAEGAAAETAAETGAGTAFSGAESSAAVTPENETTEQPDGEEQESGEQSTEQEGEAGEFDAAAQMEAALKDFELPEGMIFEGADKEGLQAIVGEHKIPSDAIKALMDYQVKREQARAQTMVAQQQAYINDMRKEAEALPPETMAGARQFVTKYGSEGLQAKMADPNFFIGNDPDILNAFALAHKAASGGFVDGDGSGGTNTPLADRFCGK